MVDESDDVHVAGALGADQRICFSPALYSQSYSERIPSLKKSAKTLPMMSLAFFLG